MSLLPLNANEALYYELDQPSRTDAPTFVFVNAITGDTSMWQAAVGPALRSAGFGTLCWTLDPQQNRRGLQGGSIE